MAAPNAAPTLSRGLLSDQIYDWVKSSITNGTLAPDAQLVESRLARELQVSQAPVREALQRLAHEGLVTHRPNRGNFVTSFSTEQSRQARVARAALEQLSGQLACGNVHPEERYQLASIVEDMHDAAAEGDVPTFRELDFLFHRTVIEISGNVHLPRMWDIIEPSLRSLHVLSDPGFSGNWKDVADSHLRLLTVLEDGDPETAGTLFKRHALGRALSGQNENR